MVVLHESHGSSSSNKHIFKKLRSRDVPVSDNPRRPRIAENSWCEKTAENADSCHWREAASFKWTVRKKGDHDYAMKYVAVALDFYNKHSVQQYQLVKTGGYRPVLLPKGFIYHIDFIAINTHVADAPEEKFFAELSSIPTVEGYCVRLCVSLGPVNSLSAERLNGCQYCAPHKNVWHPKSGGFVRGEDFIFKTVEEICGIPMLDESELSISMLEVHDARQYATETVKFVNQRTDRNFELVNPGFGTRVILPTCSLYHLNFKAKEMYPRAPHMLFFAELTVTFSGDLSVDNYTVLKDADIKSGNEAGDKTNGCYYCHKYGKVRHPFLGGFVRGGDSLYLSDNEFKFEEEKDLFLFNL